MDRITEVSEIREHLGDHPDSMNVLLATSTQVLLDTGEEAPDERHVVCEGNSFQLEGFVLHPRRLLCQPVELVLTDPGEVDYVLGLIRESVAVMAALTGDAASFATQRAPGGLSHGPLGSRLPV